jgi:sodium/pantothenate symporter
MRWDIATPIFLYLIAMFLVGAYFHRYLKNKDDEESNFMQQYFVGGRSLGPFVLAFTITASFASAATFIGAPGLAYQIGFAWPLVLVGQIASSFYILGILGKKFAIIARKIEAVTLTDFLLARYQSKFVVIGYAVGVVFFLGAYMVAQFVGGAIIFEVVTGLPYQVGLLIFGALVVAYTAYGGLRAVAFTDAIQGLLMLVGGVLLWVAFIVVTGGFSKVIPQLASQNPEMLTLPGPLDITPLIMFSYFVLLGIAAVGLPHAAVRGMMYPDTRTLHRTLIYATIILTLFSIFFASLGPAMRVLYPDLGNPDAALPTFIVEAFPGWIAGLILAAPLAAIMSTVDSMLLVTSSAVVKDIYSNYVNPEASQRSLSRLSYLSTVLIGLVVVGVAFTPPDFLQLVVLFAIGGLQSMFVAPIVFGLYWKRATKWGGVASMYVGLVSYIVLELWFENPFGMIPLVTSLILSIAAMILASLLTPKPSTEVIQRFWGP